MHDPHLHIGNGDTFLLKPRRSGSLDPPGSFQGIKRLPCLVQQLTDFLGGLGRELFILQILFMGFFLIIPVRILLYPSFFVMLTLVITDIPELGCCIAHMSDEVRIFPADLYGCFLWQQHFLSSIVSVRFALMFDVPADIFFRYRSDRFHIIGIVPQLPFPKLVSYFRKTFEKFPAGDPLQVFHWPYHMVINITHKCGNV